MGRRHLWCLLLVITAFRLHQGSNECFCPACCLPTAVSLLSQPSPRLHRYLKPTGSCLLTSIGHRPLRVRGQALPQLPLLLLCHLQAEVLQNLPQEQQALNRKILNRKNGLKHVLGAHGAGFLLEVAPRTSCCGSRVGLDFQSLLSYSCTAMPVPGDTFTTLQEHFMQMANRFSAI